MSQQKEYNFHAHGMHCKSCELLIESHLMEIAGVVKVYADSSNGSVRVITTKDGSTEELAEEFSERIRNDGYTLSATHREKKERLWKDFFYAIPITAAFVAVFVLLQKLGIVRFISSDTVTFSTAFLIGLVASVSSCLAVVGGLLLSISAEYAKQGSQRKPQVLFHAGRLAAFFILGGVIGALGAVFTLNTGVTVVLSIVIGIVMLILGINLLDVFPWAKKFQLHMPKFITRRTSHVQRINSGVTPFLIGVSTFFLPCGFTQSMQLYTLSTGTFLAGALTMTGFALGTLPVLALISFTSFRLGKGPAASVFFKTAGILVILFALLNIANALVVLGVVNPFMSL